MKKPKDIDKELRAKGIVTTPTRLQILKDRLDNPKTSEKERWNILMFLLEYHMDTIDVFDWLDKLTTMTEGYLNDARN